MLGGATGTQRDLSRFLWELTLLQSSFLFGLSGLFGLPLCGTSNPLCLLSLEASQRLPKLYIAPQFRTMTPSLHSRFISKEILTIREAVWLTDNTYKYEDLVRMMGEIISALEGKIRVSGVWAFL